MQKTQGTLDRQLTLLQLLPRHPRTKSTTELATALAARGFSVTGRTIERDLRALSLRFAILADETRKPFCWAWSAAAPPVAIPGLTETEAATLKLVQEALNLALPGELTRQLTPWFGVADERLKEANPRRVKVLLASLRSWPATQPLHPPQVKPEILVGLLDALIDGRAVGVRYVARDGALRTLTLHPAGLVQRGPVTYLVATASGYQDVRTYALQRFRAVTVLDEPALRPAGFTIDGYLATGVLGYGDGKKLVLEAVFEPAAADHLYETPLALDQTLTVQEDGRVRLRAKVLDTGQLRWWLRAFGEDVEVVKPIALRRAFATTAAALARRYKD